MTLSLFLLCTGHSNELPKKDMRVSFDQEIDTIKMVSGITKYAVRIDSPDDFSYELEKAYFKAFENRKGPVVLDIHQSVLSTKVNPKIIKSYKSIQQKKSKWKFKINNIINQIYKSN